VGLLSAFHICHDACLNERTRPAQPEVHLRKHFLRNSAARPQSSARQVLRVLRSVVTFQNHPMM
jgi:hypothetical protein